MCSGKYGVEQPGPMDINWRPHTTNIVSVFIVQYRLKCLHQVDKQIGLLYNYYYYSGFGVV